MRIMIVEDEPPIARLLASILRNCCAEAEIVAMAGDGQQALADFEATRPQIVFTDIRMPGMDGIALMERLHALDDGVRLVVVSGYSEFEYARSALRLGATDYLLKPLSPGKIAELMARFERELRQEKAEDIRHDMERQLRGHASHLDNPESCGLLLLCAGPLPVSADDSMTPGKAFWEQADVIEALEGAGGAWHFEGRTTAEKILVFMEQENANNWFRKLFDTLKALDGPVLTGVYAEHGVPAAQIGGTLRQMRALLSRRIQIWAPALLCCPLSAEQEQAEGSRAFQKASTQAAGRIAAAMKAQRPDLLEQELRKVFDRLRQEAATQREFEYLFRKLADAFSEQGPKPNASFHGGLDDLLTNAVDAQELYDGLLSTLTYYSTQPGGEAERPVLNHIRDYLNQHYREPVSYSTLSKEFGFVPSYLSTLFRAGLGVSPAGYLTNLRISKAKEFLAENPHAMVKEVAEQVGYEDPLHFSRIFKKVTGVSPKEYQSGGR